MAYRPTEKTQARKAAVKDKLVKAAFKLVATGGFNALTIAGAAYAADMATGAVYKHFESKALLCAEVFRLATEKEVAMVRAAGSGEASPTERMLNAIAVFSERALRGRRLAYALIAEPVDTLVDVERLRFRQAYAVLYRQLIEEGIRSGDFCPQDATVSAAALVGAIPEALVGPLSWQRDSPPAESQDLLIKSIQDFCLRALTASVPGV